MDPRYGGRTGEGGLDGRPGLPDRSAAAGAAHAPAAALAGARLQGRRPDGDLGKQLFDGIRSTPRELEALRTASWPEEQLPLAGVATLFLRGERTDRAVYPTPEQISSWVADAEVQTLPGQDHLATTFGPHDVATRILDFAGRH